MAHMDPARAAQRWAQQMQNVASKVTEGVSQVVRSPTEAAAARQQAYVDGVQRAAQSGKWARGLRRVSLPQWQQAMIDKGIPRIASGATAAEPKVQQFLAEFLPHVASGVNSLPQRGTLEQNTARAVAMIQHNAKFKRRS